MHKLANFDWVTATDIKVFCLGIITSFINAEHAADILLLQIETMSWFEVTKGIFTLITVFATAVYVVFRAIKEYHNTRKAKFESKAQEWKAKQEEEVWTSSRDIRKKMNQEEGII